MRFSGAYMARNVGSNRIEFISCPCPKQILDRNYPDDPQIFNEKIAEGSLGCEFEIKELAAPLGIAENRVIKGGATGGGREKRS